VTLVYTSEWDVFYYLGPFFTVVRWGGGSASLGSGGLIRAILFPPAAQEDQLFGAQLGPEVGFSFLVRPVSRAQRPLDVDGFTLPDILFGELRETPPEHDAVPGCDLRTVFTALVGGETEIRHGLAGLGVTKDDVISNVSDDCGSVVSTQIYILMKCPHLL